MNRLLTNLSAYSVLALALLSSSAFAVTRSSSQRFAADQVEALRVQVDFHDVEVAVTPGKTVTVDLQTSFSGVGLNLDAEVPRVSLQGRTLSVVSRPRTGLALTVGNLRGRLRVVLPPGKVLNLTTDSGHCRVSGAATGARLSCATDSGDIGVSAASTALSVRSDSGNIEVSGFAPTVQLRTNSGRIHASAGGQVTARSDSGHLSFEGLTGTLTARSDSGRLSARWREAPPAGRIALQTDSGDIDARFPVGLKLGGTVRSESGTVSVAPPGVRHEGDGGTRVELGQASLTLTVTSDSGNILVGWDR